MRTNGRILLGVLAAMLMPSCASTSDAEAIGRYVFDVYEENYAWGHTLRGFFIEGDGTVSVYDHSGHRWVPDPDRAGRVDDVDLAEKFDGAKPILEIGPDTVRQKADLIDRAAHGAISKYSQSRDRGRFAYVAYLYDPDRRDYRTIVLGADGDWMETNNSPAAQDLLTWLKSVKEKVSDATR
jgi:hypothetical protein